MTEKPTEDQMVRVLAERGMGWTEALPGLWYVPDPLFEPPAEEEWTLAVPAGWNPFTSPADAFMLVEKMREKGWHFNLNSPMMGEGWVAQLLKGNDFYRPRWIVGGNSEAVDISSDVRVWNFKVEADTPCRAIALAAAAALEGE